MKVENSINKLNVGRGASYCRGYNSSELFSAMDFGNLPIANELQIERHLNTETFPLHLRICKTCGLGQIGETVPPERLFFDYRYRSSMSTTFNDHAKSFVEDAISKYQIDVKEDWILEIASNDGYLLKHFQEKGARVIGVEPSKNISAISETIGINTINAFFSAELASHIVKTFGHPKLVIANNVLAHVPNLLDFLEGLELLASKDTIITIENPSLINLSKDLQFDSVYHEHYSYLTAFALNTILNQFSLSLAHVEKIDVHGGSNRYVLKRRRNSGSQSKEVKNLIRDELASGLLEEEIWSRFREQVFAISEDFHNFMYQMNKDTRRVLGYGAAAKASTLLNYSNIPSNWLMGIVDSNPEKIDRFMPTEMYPILSPEFAQHLKPTDVVIFPWNIKQELAKRIRQEFSYPIDIWTVVPKIKKLQ